MEQMKNKAKVAREKTYPLRKGHFDGPAIIRTKKTTKEYKEAIITRTKQRIEKIKSSIFVENIKESFEKISKKIL